MVKMSRKPATQFFVLLMVIIFVITWAAWQALAQSTAAESDFGQEQSDSVDSGGDSRAALIMDASDSMRAEDIEGGGTRLDAAKQAADQLVDSLPETAVLGMLVYGASESNAPDNRERGCQDIDVLAPLERINKDELKGEIDSLQAQGYTPMGNALRAAADELGSEGDRSIILVSDGIDTCAPPPVCEVAEELAGDGFDMTIHTVGFKADEEARDELECISEVSGGTFVEADNAEELGNQLEFLAQRGAEGYQASGTEFEYADTIEDAQWLDEGQYRTKVKLSSTEGEVGYFRVAVPEGHNAYVSVTGVPHRDATGMAATGTDGSAFIRIAEVSNQTDGSDCRAKDSLSVSSQGSIEMRNYEPTVPVTSFINGEEVGNCDMDEWTIGHSFITGSEKDLSGEELTAEVNVYYEPVVPETVIQPEGDSGSLGNEDPEVKFGEAQDIESGTSFNDAVEIEPGTYTNSIVAGEAQYYKIPVEWGQVPQVAIRHRLNENIDHAWITAQLVNPVKTPVTDAYMVEFGSGDAEAAHLMADRPVRYNNRNVNAGGWYSSIAGDYFIAISMSLPSEEDALRNIDQEYQFAVDLGGAIDEGSQWRPTYKPGPEPSDTPPTFEAASSAAEETTPAADGEGAEKEAENADTESAAAADSSDGGPSALVWVTIGVLVLGLLAIIAAVVLHRRKNQ